MSTIRFVEDIRSLYAWDECSDMKHAYTPEDVIENIVRDYKLMQRKPTRRGGARRIRGPRRRRSSK